MKMRCKAVQGSSSSARLWGPRKCIVYPRVLFHRVIAVFLLQIGGGEGRGREFDGRYNSR